jgi:hypothetical protein
MIIVNILINLISSDSRKVRSKLKKGESLQNQRPGTETGHDISIIPFLILKFFGTKFTHGPLAIIKSASNMCYDF